MVKRKDVQAVIDGILSGKILEAFESYYHDDVVMSENGAQERVGDANREYEEQFVNNVEFHGAEAVTVLIDGDQAPRGLAGNPAATSVERSRRS